MKQTIVLFTILLLFGCSSFTPAEDSGSTPEGVAEVVQGNNQLAFDLYEQFVSKAGDENILFSPYSISTALTIAYEGARGQTAEEMQSALHIPQDTTARQANNAKIYNQLNDGGKDFRLSTANAMWAQQDYKFLQEYFTVVDTYYRGEATNLDFNQKEESAKTINTWVEDQTKNKIKDLVPVSAISDATRLVITNAIYFKGDWEKQFDKKKTRDEPFTTSSAAIVQVPMMQLTGEDANFNYAETEEVQVLELPYEGNALSMLIVLPKGSSVNLSSENTALWRSRLSNQLVSVYVPRFKFETKYFMIPTLKQMGMNSAFSDSADFSGMTGIQDLYISNVIHQAFVEMNEEGTEAAAATAVMMREKMAMPEYMFRADHPFIFIIQQKDTGNILFIGRVSDPSK